jgi:nitroimidazol reductase NimA-like FMN-containing flavoprotein (pyridoxamine 5'-phosphate oxidase superfamily)
MYDPLTSLWMHDDLIIEELLIMLEKIKTIVRENDICVLATTGANDPHTSLMAYACSEDCTEIYMVTPVKTLKYRNLTANAKVSLLVDTREKEHRASIQALTITGQAHTIRDAVKKDAVRKQIQLQHAHLQGLLDQPEIAFICVRIESFQLQSGVHEAYYKRMAENAGL